MPNWVVFQQPAKAQKAVAAVKGDCRVRRSSFVAPAGSLCHPCSAALRSASGLTWISTTSRARSGAVLFSLKVFETGVPVTPNSPSNACALGVWAQPSTELRFHDIDAVFKEHLTINKGQLSDDHRTSEPCQLPTSGKPLLITAVEHSQLSSLVTFHAQSRRFSGLRRNRKAAVGHCAGALFLDRLLRFAPRSAPAVCGRAKGYSPWSSS
jgi:hypothetical protein